MRRTSYLLLLVFLPLFFIGCGGGKISDNSPSALTGTVFISVPMPKTTARSISDIASVTVTVTGPEITTPIVKDLSFNPDTKAWEAKFQVPIGIDRLFTVVAKDADGVPLYTGSAKSDVKVNQVTKVTVHLYVDETTQGYVSLAVTFDNPYLGIGKIAACVGHFTKPGQNPNYGSVVPEDQIAEQYAVIRKYCDAVRTYSSTHGNEHAVKYAAQYGLRIALGVWIGRDNNSNDAEIQAAINLAKQGTIDSIVVGSEVLLRNDKTEEELITYINRVKSAVSVPVTYADTWNIWWNNGNGRPELANSVDYIMIHCWPYWEGVSINQAITNIADNFQKVRNVYPGKRVVIGEVGWPSAGLPNGVAVPSEINQRRFLKDFVEWARANNIEFFVFEFFDEPWKTAEPYGVGPHWGFFNSDYTIKPEIRKIWF